MYSRIVSRSPPAIPTSSRTARTALSKLLQSTGGLRRRTWRSLRHSNGVYALREHDIATTQNGRVVPKVIRQQTACPQFLPPLPPQLRDHRRHFKVAVRLPVCIARWKLSDRSGRLRPNSFDVRAATEFTGPARRVVSTSVRRVTRELSDSCQYPPGRSATLVTSGEVDGEKATLDLPLRTSPSRQRFNSLSGFRFFGPCGSSRRTDCVTLIGLW
jgi:hypothetical protein